MFKTIKPYIDAGWYTVPLGGELKRLPDGSKTEPAFEKNWKVKYAQEFNTNATKLGGALTGKISNIMAVDCDNTITYNMFRALCTPDVLVFKSKGKGDKVCGTLVFSYSDDLPDSFSINDGTIALDFYSNSGFIYVPTLANETKEQIEKLEPTELPLEIMIMLKQFKIAAESSKAKVGTTVRHMSSAMCLQPLVQSFTENRKFVPGLFKIITPKDFRTEPQYIKSGYLHPDNVPQGRGSEYLSKISAIMGADISIDEQLFCDAMHEINKLWTSPMDPLRLDKTIIEPMISESASINGVSIWQYDENWAQRRLVLRTKRQSSVEIGFDDRRDAYYVVDIANEYIKSFGKDNDLVAYLEATSYNTPKKLDIKKTIPLLNVTSVPGKTFGFHEGDHEVRELNTFIRTPELAIINEPELYKQFYKPPTTTLRFLEALVPDEQMRKYLLKFLKRKLLKFEYSPVILYFLGVHGSGKDTFVEILKIIMGRITKPTTKQFLEMFNGWMLDSYFVQLDEYGNQLTNLRDREEVLGKLKTYTGSPFVEIRMMRTDSYDYYHNATFIMTANKQPLMFEDGDRRIAFFSTPNVLKEEEWVENVSATRTTILEEVKDFCYYLATEISLMDLSEFTTPPETKEKHKLIADSMHPSAKLAYVLKHKMLDYFKDLATEFGSQKVVNAIEQGRVYTTDLEDLYSLMTDHNGDMRTLNKIIKASGIGMKPTTIGGTKAYYYDLWFNNPFVSDENE